MAHAYALPAVDEPEERHGFISAPEEDDVREQLTRSWDEGPGLYAWLTSTNHKSISKRYIITALVFFALGGIEAAVIRLQLSRPANHFVGPDLYNQIFTVHGSTMMFLFAVPVMEAIGLYMVPIMIGTRNVSFPRLNELG